MAEILTAAVSLFVLLWVVEYFSRRKPKGGSCFLMAELKGFKDMTIVYPINNNRPEARVKTWNVAVSTSEPDMRFETHAAWMLHILLEHAYTIKCLCDAETEEIRDAVNAYKEKGLDNRRVVTPQALSKHEK